MLTVPGSAMASFFMNPAAAMSQQNMMGQTQDTQQDYHSHRRQRAMRYSADGTFGHVNTADYGMTSWQLASIIVGGAGVVSLLIVLIILSCQRGQQSRRIKESRAHSREYAEDMN